MSDARNHSSRRVGHVIPNQTECADDYASTILRFIHGTWYELMPLISWGTRATSASLQLLLLGQVLLIDVLSSTDGARNLDGE